jgi:hypothetical protein
MTNSDKTAFFTPGKIFLYTLMLNGLLIGYILYRMSDLSNYGPMLLVFDIQVVIASLFMIMVYSIKVWRGLLAEGVIGILHAGGLIESSERWRVEPMGGAEVLYSVVLLVISSSILITFITEILPTLGY